jgi:hypothetical protein
MTPKIFNMNYLITLSILKQEFIGNQLVTYLTINQKPKEKFQKAQSSHYTVHQQEIVSNSNILYQ